MSACLMVGPSELFEGDARVEDGQSVDPDAPAAELVSQGVEEEAAQNLHHRRRGVAVLPVRREERGQSNHPVLPYGHLQDGSRGKMESSKL